MRLNRGNLVFRFLTAAVAVTASWLFCLHGFCANNESPGSQQAHAPGTEKRDASYYLVSGDKNFRSSNFDIAREDYAYYVRLILNVSAAVVGRLAVCDAWGGEFDLAVKEFDQAADLAGPGQVADLDRIDASIVGQKYDEAVERAKACCKRYPNAWKPFWRYGFINDKYACYPEAVKAYSKAIELMPQSNLASDDFEEIAGLPNGKGLYSLRAQCFYRVQNYSACLKDCDRVVGYAPDERQSYEARAEVKIQIGDLSGALADLEKAVRLHSNRARTYKQRGLCQLKLGRYSSAVASLTSAIVLFKDYAEAYHLRSKAYKLMGKNEEATRDEDEARRLGLHAASPA